ncbi:MAG: hypothetical protein ACTTJ7_04130 [Treponema sp.]
MPNAFLDFLTVLPEENMRKKLIKAFLLHYGASTEALSLVQVPLSVTVLGGYADYGGGKALGAALNRYLYLLIRKRSDSTAAYYDLRSFSEKAHSLSDIQSNQAGHSYAACFNAVITAFEHNGLHCDTGFELLIFNNFPIDYDIFSSTALKIGFAQALVEAFQFSVEPLALVKMERAGLESTENRAIQESAVNHDIHYDTTHRISLLMGKQNHILLTDPAVYEYTAMQLPPTEHACVMLRPHIRTLFFTERSRERYHACMKALHILHQEKKIQTLCDVTEADISWLETEQHQAQLAKQLRYWVSEQERVQQAATALREGDLASFGKCMREAQAALQTLHEIDEQNLTLLADTANAQAACLGACIARSEADACVIALVSQRTLEDFIVQIKKQYTEQTGYAPSVLLCGISGGIKKQRLETAE